jgi:Iron/manganese superoxide dismutases, C-terminal domain
LHSISWKNLTPGGGGEPKGELGRLVVHDFGGFEPFKKQPTEVASTIMGSGWAALVWEPLAKKLMTAQIYDHQSNLGQGGVPLLVIDAWRPPSSMQSGTSGTGTTSTPVSRSRADCRKSTPACHSAHRRPAGPDEDTARSTPIRAHKVGARGGFPVAGTLQALAPSGVGSKRRGQFPRE